MATIDDFKKIDLRVGKVIAAERVEGSEKLLKLQIDFGMEQRQIVSGIGRSYAPETLVGRELAVVVNLEPRMLMGLESQGMILAAAGEGGPVVLVPEKETPPGASIT